MSKNRETFRLLTEQEEKDGYGYCFRNKPFDTSYYSKQVILENTDEPIDINQFISMHPWKTMWYTSRKNEIEYMGIGKPHKQSAKLISFIGTKKEDIIVKKAVSDKGSTIVKYVSACINCGDIISDKEEKDLCIICRTNPYYTVHSSNITKVNKQEKSESLQKLNRFLISRN